MTYKTCFTSIINATNLFHNVPIQLKQTCHLGMIMIQYRAGWSNEYQIIYQL